MDKGRIFLADETATDAFGRVLAAQLEPGTCIALVGGLGAGKTHLAKGIVAGLGSLAEVTSPTFALVHEYSGSRLPVFHFDFYRIESADALLGIGWDEYLDAGGVIIAEWADRFPDLLPPGTQWWRLGGADRGGRQIERLDKAPGA